MKSNRENRKNIKGLAQKVNTKIIGFPERKNRGKKRRRRRRQEELKK